MNQSTLLTRLMPIVYLASGELDACDRGVYDSYPEHLVVCLPDGKVEAGYVQNLLSECDLGACRTRAAILLVNDGSIRRLRLYVSGSQDLSHVYLAESGVKIEEISVILIRDGLDIDLELNFGNNSVPVDSMRRVVASIRSRDAVSTTSLQAPVPTNPFASAVPKAVERRFGHGAVEFCPDGWLDPGGPLPQEEYLNEIRDQDRDDEGAVNERDS